ncbi:MAG: metalloprotease family protein [Bacteroidota bacterium]
MGIFCFESSEIKKFGVKWKHLTPYCHCKEPLKVKHYKVGGAMPLLVMGIIPSIIGLIIGHGGFLSFGIFFSWAAGGDIIALYLLRKLDNNIYVSDHPEKMGFIIGYAQIPPNE